MSTKTTFKRIALVAVAALGLGMLSVAPSSATNILAGSGNIIVDYNYGPTDSPAKPAILISSDAATNKAILVIRDQFRATADGGFDTVSITPIQQVYSSTGLMNSTYPYFDAADAGVAAMDTYSAANNATTAVQTVTSVLKVTATVAGPAVGQHVIKFAPQLPGTYKFLISSTSGGSYTWEVTAVLPDNAISATGTTSFLNAGEAVAATTDATVSASMAVATSAAATIVVTPKNAAGTTISTVTFPLTVTVSGPGTVAVGTNLAAITALSAGTGRAVTGTTGHYVIGVFADGTAGVSTVTVSSGTTVLSTEKVTFYGAPVKLTATASVKSVVDTAGSTAVATITAVDAAGVAVPLVAGDGAVVETTTALGVTATSDADAAGVVTVSVDPEATKNGLKTLTWKTTDGLLTASFSFNVGLAKATTVTIAPSDASVVPGQRFTLTVTAKDAGGFALPDGATTIALSFGRASSVTLPTSVTLSGGSGTVEVYAPITPGSLAMTATITNADATTAVGTGSVDVSDPSQAATDAAAEAIDAANAATDAANAAAEAADAATAAAQDAADAVAALSVAVTAQIDALKAQNESLRKQLIALTNLIIKIQKKVKA